MPFKRLLGAAALIASGSVAALAQTARVGERPDPPNASELVHELSGWFGSHPGVEIALGICVVTAIVTVAYHRIRG